MCYWYYSPYELVPQIFAKSELFRSMWSGILVQSVTRRFGPYFPHRSELIWSIFFFSIQKESRKKSQTGPTTVLGPNGLWKITDLGTDHCISDHGPDRITLCQDFGLRTGPNKIGPNLLTTDRTKTVGPIIQGSIECSGWKFDVRQSSRRNNQVWITWRILGKVKPNKKYVKSSKKAEKDKIEILPSRKYFDWPQNKLYNCHLHTTY